jgi:uncharacterized protein YndB with AHSA1/START domain
MTAKGLLGRWRIVEMELWNPEAIDLLGPAFIEFAPDNTGTFRFIAVQGSMDVRQVGGEGPHRVEFTWEGDDDGEPSSGRGWASPAEGGALTGRIFFHMGDDSGFRAVHPSDAQGVAPS